MREGAGREVWLGLVVICWADTDAPPLLCKLVVASIAVCWLVVAQATVLL